MVGQITNRYYTAIGNDRYENSVRDVPRTARGYRSYMDREGYRTIQSLGNNAAALILPTDYRIKTYIRATGQSLRIHPMWKLR